MDTQGEGVSGPMEKFRGGALGPVPTDKITNGRTSGTTPTETVKSGALGPAFTDTRGSDGLSGPTPTE